MLDLILDRLSGMQLPADRKKAEALRRYHNMLIDTNKRMNLTRVPADISEAIDRNYLDSLGALAHLDGVSSLIDVGSGAGLPGIPLSIFLPDVHMVLMDSLNKRVEFLLSVIQALSLNAEALASRAEDAGRGNMRESFDVAISRAVAPMNVLAELMLPLVKVGGRMLAYKGPGVELELGEAKKAIDVLGGKLLEIATVKIPGRDWDHRIVIIEKIASTPEKYPRRAGTPERKPIL